MLKTAPHWNPNLISAVADADQKQATSKKSFWVAMSLFACTSSPYVTFCH